MVKYLLFAQQPAMNKRRMVLGGKRRPQLTSSPVSKRPQWNSYLTEEGIHALSKTEQLRRKQLAVSKHNILQSDGIAPARTLRSVRSVASSSVSTLDGASPASYTARTPKKLLESKDDLHISAFGTSSITGNDTSHNHSTSKDTTALDLLSPITPSVRCFHPSQPLSVCPQTH